MNRAWLLALVVAAPPLPSLPVLSRVRIEAQQGHVVITEDVRLERGDWSSGDLDLWVSFGAPGVPRAFDAHLVPVAPDAFFADPDDKGEALAVEKQPRKPQRARLLLGREAMAGVVVHAKEPALRRAFALSGVLVLRLRSLVDGSDVLVRLGTDGAAPIAIGIIEVVGDAKTVARADAKLCGPNADPYPLAVTLVPARAMPIAYPRPQAPSLAARHDGDDLCVRIFAP